MNLAVLSGVAHAMLIEGTMDMLSKATLCLLVLIATGKIMADLKIWWSFRNRNR
ncbi:hypothetical protein [Limimaricola litoreus]|uniref:hypothetical protein n=1 Tax=Limimaricola litoreus TaxID=2955316 RepID=UPI00351386B0